jgi:hypothetical protein
MLKPGLTGKQMLEFGSTEKWTAKQCRQKWQDLSWLECGPSQPILRTPTYSTAYTASPVEYPNPLGLYMKAEKADVFPG